MKNIKNRYEFSIHVYEVKATVFNLEDENIHFIFALTSLAVRRK